MALPRELDEHRPDPAARRRRRPDRPLRRDRPERRRQDVALQPVVRRGQARRARHVPLRRVRGRVAAAPVQRLHVLPRRPGRRRPVRAVREPQHGRLRDEPVRRHAPLRHRHGEHDRPAGARTTGSTRSRCTTTSTACGSTRRVSIASRKASLGLYCREQDRLDRLVPQRRRRALRRLSLRRRQRHRRELGHRRRAHRIAEAVADLRAVGEDRVLRQLRPRLPQQRRARRDEHRVADRRQPDREGDPAGEVARRGDRRAHADRAGPAELDRAVAAHARVRARVLRRRRRHGAEPREPSARHRVEQPLHRGAVAAVRSRRRDLARAVHAARSGRRLHPRVDRQGGVVRRQRARSRPVVRARPAALLRPATADRGRQRAIERRRRSRRRASATT